MAKLFKLNLLIGIVLFFASCATSMSPLAVNDKLPTMTKSKYFSQSQAEEAIKSHRCTYLIKGRSVVADMGLTTKADLRNGAKGIDEWVKLDGGNSYVLISYKWNAAGGFGSTQLQIDFDTMLCE